MVERLCAVHACGPQWRSRQKRPVAVSRDLMRQSVAAGEANAADDLTRRIIGDHRGGDGEVSRAHTRLATPCH